jgi:hypothetical protein
VPSVAPEDFVVYVNILAMTTGLVYLTLLGWIGRTIQAAVMNQRMNVLA